MKTKLYTAALIVMALIASLPAQAQIGGTFVIDGTLDLTKNDSTVFTFLPDDSLTHTYRMGSVIVDTAGVQLWQIGATSKAFFADSGMVATGIMTDTTGFYPIAANEAFVVKLLYYNYSTIVGFDHKFQTSAGLDGGIVEFSRDEGLTWENVMGDCNNDSTSDWGIGIYTDRFYSKSDTLWNGETGFSGSSDGWLNSRFQFLSPMPLKGADLCFFPSTLYVRFRFVSDTTADSLAGWLIGNIKIENDYYGSGIADRQARALQVAPNPSAGIFYFPELSGSRTCSVRITDLNGQILLQQPYRRQIDLKAYPAGIYFYEVIDGKDVYRGRLLKK